MMHRRPSKRSGAIAIGSFTVMDELLASPTEPDPAYHAQRIAIARDALALMQRPDTATVGAWSVCCMVGNTLETMLQQQLASDPEGALQDAFEALKRAAQAVRAPGEPITLPAADWLLLAGMVDDWAAILEQAPARDVIRAFRATDRRVREIEAGRLQAHDVTVRSAAA